MQRTLARTVIILVLLASIWVVTGCGAALEDVGGGAPPTAPTPSTGGEAPPPAPGPCQSMLWGVVIDQGTGQNAPGTTVQLFKGDLKLEAVSDDNGMYGFAGLCAGEYVVHLVGPEGVIAVTPDQTVVLDGQANVKQDLAFQK